MIPAAVYHAEQKIFSMAKTRGFPLQSPRIVRCQYAVHFSTEKDEDEFGESDSALPQACDYCSS